MSLTVKEAEAMLKCLERWPDYKNDWFDDIFMVKRFKREGGCPKSVAMEHG